MKESAEEKSWRQKEKIDRLRELSDEEVGRLNQQGEAEAERIMERFKKRPPRGRRG